MSDSYAKFKEDLSEYRFLCRLLNEKELTAGWLDHFYALKVILE